MRLNGLSIERLQIHLALLLLPIAICGCSAHRPGAEADLHPARISNVEPAQTNRLTVVRPNSIQTTNHDPANGSPGKTNIEFSDYENEKRTDRILINADIHKATQATQNISSDRQVQPKIKDSSVRLVSATQQASNESVISVFDVAQSIHSTFPLVEAVYQDLEITAGNRIAAWGAFDDKIKASSENGSLGFYENYRHGASLNRPIFQGGEVFSGYRVGRGDFEPWYLERQTNEGGEFKIGIRRPLLRDREIDARRAELFRATYDQQIAQPEIFAQVVIFVRDGSFAFWEWIAAGERYQIGKQALSLAEQRNSQLKRKVELGDVDPPVLQDNLRAIAQREAKLIDLRRKLEQSAIKLSLYYRDANGQPIIAAESQLTEFPEPQQANPEQLQGDILSALSVHPELVAIDAQIRKVNVSLAEAQNKFLPAVDMQFVGSQDVGAPTSSTRDKSQFELEAGVFVDVPLQRREAIGKVQAATSKVIQLGAKRRFSEDKIRATIQSSYAALVAAYERLNKARESKRLADYMAGIEQRKFELGEGDLLSVALREQIAIEAAEAEVDALLEYFTARADYNAALARDWPIGTTN